MVTEAVTADSADMEASATRERSTIGFPYGDLDDAISIAKAVHEVGGSSCQVEQLAAHLNMIPTGGGFRIKTISAKVFGLTQYSQGTNRLTPLGQRIVDPTQERKARVEAFLTVPLYKAIYDKFRSGTLPPASALESEMVGLGVAKKQADKARQTFQRSAMQAGFLWAGTDRLVLPKGTAEAPETHEQRHPKHADDEHNGKTETGKIGASGGGGGNGGERHPFIAGLLKELPTEGAEWSTDERRKWLQAAAMIFDLIYKNSGNGLPLKIEIETAK